MYFHQFAAAAAGHGLQYVAEAVPQPLPGHIKPEVLQALAAASDDRLRLEQYLDYLRCRVFRRSVLCHAAAKPDFEGAAQRVPRLAVSSEAKPEADARNPDPAATESFVTPNKLRFTTSDPALRAVLCRLSESRPAAVPFAELAAVAGRTDGLAQSLLQLYLGDIVMLHLHPPVLTAQPGPRPTASPLARWQAARGADSIHDLRHRLAKPDPFGRYLLPLLDGTRDRAALVELLAAKSMAGEFEVRDGAGKPATEPDLIRQVLSTWVDDALGRLAKSALLLN
jgi:methyltransferase-like protein